MLENSISDYIKTYASNCFEELKNITEYLSIKYNLENVSTKILENNLVTSIYAPTKIQFASSTHELNRFNAELNNNRLYDIYTFSEYLVNKQLEDKYSICLSCIVNKAVEQDFYVDIENMGNNSFIFSVMYNNTDSLKLNKFIFANKYKQISCTKLPIDSNEIFLERFTEDCIRKEIESFNYSIKIQDVKNLNAYVGIPFEIKIQASGSNLTFNDYTDLFEIDKKLGIINFIPLDEQIGEHIVLISIFDGLGNEEFRFINFTIKKLENENK